jgi:hypothetical protein
MHRLAERETKREGKDWRNDAARAGLVAYTFFARTGFGHGAAGNAP